MSEEEETEEEIEEAKETAIRELPQRIRDLTRFSEGYKIREILHFIKRVDEFDQDKYIREVSLRAEIGIRKLNKVLKEIKGETPNNILKKEEDPFWLKIFRVVKKKYGKKIKAMSDSRQLMLKSGNIYTPNIKEFTKYLSEVCEEHKTSYRNVRNDVLEKFRDTYIFNRSEFSYDPYVINFKNGYYDIKEDEFIKAEDNKKKIFFYEIPHEFKGELGDYDCPEFLLALQKWLGVGNIVTPKDMFQFIGYSMTMNVGQRKAFLIKGPTLAGKTQFQEILKYLIGKENTSEISLQMLGDDKFSTSSLEWKILNMFDDLPQKDLNNVSLFKILAGGGSTFPVRRMFTEPYPGFNTVKLWYNTNVVPMVKSTEDDSFFNRWIIITFPNQFEKGGSDPIYKDIESFSKTITGNGDEIQGIIHYCIKALKILYKKGHFRDILSVNSRKTWEYESDLLYAFLDKYTTLNDNEYEFCSYFRKWYNIYRRTRHPSRRRPGVTATALNKEMDIRGYERRQKEEGGRAYIGLEFNKEFKRDKLNNFKKKSYKTTIEYLKDHPNANMNGNGEPKPEENGIEEYSFTKKDWNDKERANNKAKLIIKRQGKN